MSVSVPCGTLAAPILVPKDIKNVGDSCSGSVRPRMCIAQGPCGVRRIIRSKYKCTPVHNRAGTEAWFHHQNRTSVQFLQALHAAFWYHGFRSIWFYLYHLPCPLYLYRAIISNGTDYSLVPNIPHAWLVTAYWKRLWTLKPDKILHIFRCDKMIWSSNILEGCSRLWDWFDSRMFGVAS